jgi:membrane-bound lytic murein transglycosylase B
VPFLLAVSEVFHSRVSGPNRVHRSRALRFVTTLLVVMITFALVACSEATRSSTASTSTARPSATSPATTSTGASTLAPAQPRLASDPAQLAADLVTDEQALRDPSSSEDVLVGAARRQQAAYRMLARHPEWAANARTRIPPSLIDVYDRNVDAQVQLNALVRSDLKDTLPAWRIDPPAPAEELLGYYREAEAATGVDWNYLAAINLIETRFGRIVGMSSAGAQGPMQFLPSTFAEYGDGGDIHSPHDSIMAAARHLVANGFVDDHNHAIFRYNNSDLYVGAVNDYADVLASDPAAFAGYYRWDVYYRTTAGDVLLPIGYVATSPIPVTDYLATHPQ